MKLLRSYFIFTLLLICSVGVLHAQTTLSAGDIAFIGLYMHGSGGVNDGFTFITLKAMDAGNVTSGSEETFCALPSVQG